jgi:hypothetical protein
LLTTTAVRLSLLYQSIVKKTSNPLCRVRPAAGGAIGTAHQAAQTLSSFPCRARCSPIQGYFPRRTQHRITSPTASSLQGVRFANPLCAKRTPAGHHTSTPTPAIAHAQHQGCFPRRAHHGITSPTALFLQGMRFANPLCAKRTPAGKAHQRPRLRLPPPAQHQGRFPHRTQHRITSPTALSLQGVRFANPLCAQRTPSRTLPQQGYLRWSGQGRGWRRQRGNGEGPLQWAVVRAPLVKRHGLALSQGLAKAPWGLVRQIRRVGRRFCVPEAGSGGDGGGGTA